MVNKKIFFLTVFFALVFTLLPNVFALEFTHAISNSENWEDVYSTMLYATLEEAGSDFLVSTAHGPVLLGGISKSSDLLIVSSKSKPFVFNYGNLAESADFSSVEEIEVDSANLDLIDELPSVRNFVVVGDSYGYNAIAVSTYAVQSNSWVFLANRANIDEIDGILSERNIRDLMIYGYVDSEVTETLQKYNPEIINTGDRFEDNIEIAKKTLKINPTNQIILTNGEFIEKEIMAGTNPVLFTGRENVPESIGKYIKDSDIEIGVLIGNELIGAATNIRQSTGISVMVKFARGARDSGSSVAAVEGLDLFYLPVPTLSLSVYSIKYNKATSQIEITYQSNSNTPAYLKGTLTIISASGTVRVGDLDPVFIAPGDFKTIIYKGVEISGEEITVELFTLYGESETALDRILQDSFDVEIIDVLDRCELDVKYVKYNKQEKSFIMRVQNPSEVDCWVGVELKDVVINGIEQTIGTEISELIKSRNSKKILIEQRMTEDDLDDNSFVYLSAYYGERKDSLVNLYEGRFELKFQSLTTLTYIIILLIFIILLLIIIALILRKRDEDF